MSQAERLNEILARTHPAAARCLSDLGRRLYYQRGITVQAEQAAGCAVNATYGQLGDGLGRAMALPSMSRHLRDLSLEKALLYSPQGGSRDLRAAWRQRLAARAGEGISNPLVTIGITHAISVLADLFTGPDTDVLLPDPGWGNYQHIFRTRCGARIEGYRIMGPDGLDVQRLDDALQARSRPSVLLLNFPSNPVGYMPTPAEADAIAEAVARCPQPLVVLTDDAYQDMVWEEGRVKGSLFDRLCSLDRDRVLAAKVDGATKELFFFGGRVGFLTFGTDAEAANALEEKGIAIMRATTSSAPSPSQALVLSALGSPELEQERQTLLGVLARRYRALKLALKEAGLESWPFNSAFFALLGVDQDPEDLRLRLLEDGIGVVSIPEARALRVSYGSIADDKIPVLVEGLRRRIERQAQP